MATDVLLLPHNHFDPTWRRCWDRVAEKNGLVIRSYADVQDLVLSTWLEMAKDGVPFTEGQAVVWRKFRERRPEAWTILQSYARSGQLAVVLAGEVVQDTNLPSAEGLIRNFLIALPLYRDLCGEDHPGLRLAWLEDAFGNSPNYPQILRGVGAEAACLLSYKSLTDPVWEGIDGTRILCFDHIPITAWVGSFFKHPPCGACQGKGCQQCGHTGLNVVRGYDLDKTRQTLEQALDAPGELATIIVGSEEPLPDPRLPGLVASMNAELPDGKRLRFGTFVDAWLAKEDAIRGAAEFWDGPPNADLNPTMTGCYTTRISMKQRTRSVAYRLLAAEAALANASWHSGVPSPPPAEMSDAWRHIAFCQFHDAITGTHIDSAHPELHDMLDAAEAVANHYAPDLPAPTRTDFFTPVDREITKRLGNLDVAFDREGILSIMQDGRDVFGVLPYNELNRHFRIAELVLETDVGDAWSQRIPTFFEPGMDFSQVQLGAFNESVEAADQAIRWRGVYRGTDPKVNTLAWTVTVRPSEDGGRLDFTVEIDWDTRSHRLRVVVPVASQENHATWEVPFGFVERTWDPAQYDWSIWKADTQEYPALHWVRKTVDAISGVAVLNRGIPNCRWMPGRLDLSLLRSPEWEFCVVEPAHYDFWDIDGHRDTGHHVLEFAIRPYYNGLEEGDLTREGYAYNRADGAHLPFNVSGNVVVTAWKPAEDGSGWILRLQEAGGTGTEVVVDFNQPRTVTETDLLERPRTQPARTPRYLTPLRKHGILTLHLS